ncbi:MAG: hypothetical protein ACK4WC_15930 [Rubrimonas sp.]
MLDAIAGLIPPVLEAALAVVALASAIAALTPTPADDTAVGKVYRVVEWLALNFGHAKDQPPNRAPTGDAKAEDRAGG